MGEFLRIDVILQGAGALELTARLLALRPCWDIEMNDEGLFFEIPFLPGKIDTDLSVLENCCQIVERSKNAATIMVNVTRTNSRIVRTKPIASGPWELCFVSDADDAPSPHTGRIIALEEHVTSKRFSTCQALMLTAISNYLTPPPGAPETRGCHTLIMENVFPASAIASLLGGSGQVALLTDENSGDKARQLASLNGYNADLEIIHSTFKKLIKEKSRPDDGGWIKHFGLIAVHLSPYLGSRCLPHLSSWLAPEGVLIIAGFAPGPQTALLLRSAAKAGLCLLGSVNEGNWAAMVLAQAPLRPELPPINISLVPRLEELPSEEASEENLGELLIDRDEKEVQDEESLMAEDIEDSMQLIDEE